MMPPNASSTVQGGPPSMGKKNPLSLGNILSEESR
jgi:hypothetical protein